MWQRIKFRSLCCSSSPSPNGPPGYPNISTMKEHWSSHLQQHNTIMAQALNARNVAAAKLQEEMNQLTRYKDSQNPTARLLQQKLDKVSSAMEALRNKHYTYAEKANISLDDAGLIAYLAEKVDAAVGPLRRSVHSHRWWKECCTRRYRQSTASQVQKTNDKQRAELPCQTDEKNLQDRITSLTDYLGTA